MENPIRSCLIPQRLVMTTNTCFYCGAPSTSFYTIERFFGLKHCNLHESVARRDCCALLHSEKRVDMRDAQRHPILGKFINALDTPFPVFRSSGELQAGWRVNHTTPWEYNFIEYSNGEWKLPVTWQNEHDKSSENLVKHTPIANFKIPAIYESVKNTLSLSLVDDVLRCLIDGVYSEEHAEFESLRLQGGCEELPEIPNVHPLLYEGNVVRIMVPPPRQAEVEQTDETTDPS